MLTLNKQNELYSELMLTQIDFLRQQVSKATQKQTKSSLGQFFTEPRLASFMSDMFELNVPHVKLLDPGAGIGILTTAAVTHLCRNKKKPLSIEVIAVEIDENLIEYLRNTLEFCKKICSLNGIDFKYSIVQGDFIEYGTSLLKDTCGCFNKVIMNPPYKKISSKSKTRSTLREAGIETTNLYTAFVAISKRLLSREGELIAITPRSFCNGTYFKPFRLDFLGDMVFRKIHLFNSRTDAFKDDEVLQENIIYHAIKSDQIGNVIITSSDNLDTEVSTHKLSYDQLIHPEDTEKFIRILRDEDDLKVKTLMEKITGSLADLGISVSTGRVVDFRTKENLRDQITEDAVPLIYPTHFHEGYLRWPITPADKPNAIMKNDQTAKMLVPRGNYVLIRRFSPKEDKRRIVPAVYDEKQMGFEYVGFENHINFYHQNGSGLSLNLAKGLAIYLSSTLVDSFFRQFNGHTQVNVGDLKSLPYPSYEMILQMGESFEEFLPNQQEIDGIVSRVLGI